jgi:hypothetical protein
MPGSIEEYHALVKRALEDDAFGEAYRVRGHKAVLARHTYDIRARTIADWLGLSVCAPLQTEPLTSSSPKLSLEESRNVVTASN